MDTLTPMANPNAHEGRAALLEVHDGHFRSPVLKVYIQGRPIMNPLYQKRDAKYRKRTELDLLGSKVAIRLLRLLLAHPRSEIGVQEIAKSLKTSRTSIARRLEPLVGAGIVRASKGARGSSYRLNASSPLAEPLFEIFNYERYMSVDPTVRAALERVIASIDKRRVRCLILFGSQVHGLATPRSDVDLCLVHKEGRWREEDTSALFRHGFMKYQIEPHIYPERLFEKVPDMVALDAILSGISLHGHDYLFRNRVRVRSIDKAPILERLDVARSNLESMGLVKGPSKEYFEGLLESMLGELEALVGEGRMVPKRAIRPKGRFEERIVAMEGALADGEDVVWVR